MSPILEAPAKAAPAPIVEKKGLARRVFDFVRALAAREDLPLDEPRLVPRASFFGTLFAREALPYDPPVETPRASFWRWLLLPEPLPRDEAPAPVKTEERIPVTGGVHGP